jgi:hypothetical protein
MHLGVEDPELAAELLGEPLSFHSDADADPCAKNRNSSELGLRAGYRISREDLAAFLEASRTAKPDTRAVARLELGEGKAPGDEQGG